MILNSKSTKFICGVASPFSFFYITPTFIAIFYVPSQKYLDLRLCLFINVLLYSWFSIANRLLVHSIAPAKAIWFLVLIPNYGQFIQAEIWYYEYICLNVKVNNAI